MGRWEGTGDHHNRIGLRWWLCVRASPAPLLGCITTTSAMAFRDEVIFVTGAGGGIGEALATMVAAQGARVVILSDINADSVQRAAQNLQKVYASCKVVPVQLDVTSELQITTVFSKLEQEYGVIDCLMSNAGILSEDKAPDFLATSQSNVQWDRQWLVNTMAHVYLCRPLLPKW